MKYIDYEEAMDRPGYYLLKLHHDEFPVHGLEKGSFNVLFARLLNLSYADFLRLCRDLVGAELYGKGQLYVLPYFKLTNDFLMFVRYMNKVAEMMVERHNHPYEFILDDNGHPIGKIYDSEVKSDDDKRKNED